MKRGLAPTGVVLMGAAIALALLGVGYGLFSDTLRISGAVATGSVNAAFSLHEVDEGLARGAVNGPTDNGVNEDKEADGINAATCIVRIAGVPVPVSADVSATPSTDVSVDDSLIAGRPSDFLYVYLKGAYPGYNCYADFDVHNIGSIPLKVNDPVIGPQPASAANVLTVEFLNCYPDGTQVEPGKEALCTLHVRVERGAQPNTLYRFGATICAYQWNVSGPIRCAVPVDIEPLPADLIGATPVTAPPVVPH